MGIQWKNLLESPITDDEMNMMHCIMMMIIDTVIYGLLTWYIEAIFPGQSLLRLHTGLLSNWK